MGGDPNVPSNDTDSTASHGPRGPRPGAESPAGEHESQGQGGAGPHSSITDDLVWLRGIVQADEDAVAEFITIVPGWYAGRSPHIHLKVSNPAS